MTNRVVIDKAVTVRSATLYAAGFGEGGLPVSEAIAQRVLSLPMHPYLDAPTQDRIVAAVAAFLDALRKVHTVYAGANFELGERGLIVKPTRPHITRKADTL